MATENSVKKSDFRLKDFLKSTLFLVILLIGGLAGLYYTFGAVIPPGYMAVRQITFGPGQGFSRKGLGPGYHWTIPFYSKIHLIPSTIQVLNFHYGQAGYGEPGPLEIKTSDGADVSVDITVLSRFYQKPSEEKGKEHGGPADLITNVGASEERWKNQIVGVASDELKQGLSSLLTGEFYNPHKREEALRLAYSRMNERLKAFGISIEAVLLRRYIYRDPRIDDAIFNKNLQDQEKNLKEVSGQLAEAQAKLEREAAEWDAKNATLKVEGENQSRILRSEGALLQAQAEAEADLRVAKAQAEVDRLKAHALSQSVGAGVYVARETAPIIESLKGGIVSGVDPYDLKIWAEKLGVDRK
ncbi:MAG: hypothetical protein GYA55_08495 [SAR324 cluster bacterium]|uniref:Band 7 domain-containing protein n=1 Tax=SAR324 cluster bacterium TaxID=2024889 RepID=A0A7X9ILN8_9DELT|nr:hypothetical protein [SAR324 cluster bacterium]